ncbi:AlpA family phage regulatory protein [Lysobacter sp. HA18]
MLFDEARLYRVREIVRGHRGAGPLPISRSTWYDGVATGRFPRGVKLGVKVTAWRGADLNRIAVPDSVDPPSAARPARRPA